MVVVDVVIVVIVPFVFCCYFCLLMFISVFLGFVVSFSVISGEHASIGYVSLCTHAVLCALQLKYIQIQIQIDDIGYE